MNLDLLSTWNLIRTSGFLAYFLFTISIAAGMMNSFSIFRKQKPMLMELHKTSGWIGLLSVVFHVTLLLKDEYVPYQIKELFIPFSAQHAPLFSALGTISFYLFFITLATSDFFMKKLGRKLWKKIHFLVIPAWIFMVIHGILIGTDSGQPWAVIVYGGGVSLIAGLSAFRFLYKSPTTTKSSGLLKKTP